MYKSHRAYSSSTLSQNFIKSKITAKYVVDAACLNKKDFVIEIGPGKGALTEFILKECNKLTAVEIDKNLCKILKKDFDSQNHFELINMDFMNFQLPNKDFKIVSNIPFHITSAILNKILGSQHLISATLVVQKEAALMFGGKQAGSSIETLKSLQNFPFYTFEILGRFQKTDFQPNSKVDTVLLLINKRDPPLVAKELGSDYKKFIRIVSEVKVGHGVWKKLFTKNQLFRMQNELDLKLDKGIGQQGADAILKTFNFQKMKT